MCRKKKRSSTSLVLALSTPTRDSKFTRSRHRARPRELDISSYTKNSCDDDGGRANRRHLGDIVPIERTRNPVKFLVKSHETKKPKPLTKFLSRF